MRCYYTWMNIGVFGLNMFQIKITTKQFARFPKNLKLVF